MMSASMLAVDHVLALILPLPASFFGGVELHLSIHRAVLTMRLSSNRKSATGCIIAGVVSASESVPSRPGRPSRPSGTPRNGSVLGRWRARERRLTMRWARASRVRCRSGLSTISCGLAGRRPSGDCATRNHRGAIGSRLRVGCTAGSASLTQGSSTISSLPKS